MAGIIASNIEEQIQMLSRKMQGGVRAHGNKKYGLPGKPLVTVITVAFNSAATIEDTILSVIEQSYSNIEYLIIDGGSTDGTLDIIKKYEGKIDYWVSEKDSGIYDAMNKGISLATGDYIGMLNSDDFFSDASAMDGIVSGALSSNADAVFSCLDIVDPSNLDRILRKYRISRFSLFMLRIGVMPPHPTFYCRKSCYEMAGGYRTDFRIAADFEMLVRLLIKENITWHFIDKVTVKMRSGGLSSSGIKSRLVVNREIIRACSVNGLYTNIFILALKAPVRLRELF